MRSYRLKRGPNSGHPTLVVFTDPAHSLSDSFAKVAMRNFLTIKDAADVAIVAMHYGIQVICDTNVNQNEKRKKLAN